MQTWILNPHRNLLLNALTNRLASVRGQFLAFWPKWNDLSLQRREGEGERDIAPTNQPTQLNSKRFYQFPQSIWPTSRSKEGRRAALLPSFKFNLWRLRKLVRSRGRLGYFMRSPKLVESPCNTPGCLILAQYWMNGHFNSNSTALISQDSYVIWWK